jgi:hypothetical protein
MDYSNDAAFLRNYSSNNRFRNGAYAEHDVLTPRGEYRLLLNYKKQFGDISFDATGARESIESAMLLKCKQPASQLESFP